MESERWNKAKDIFEQALALAPLARASFLDETCPDDPAVRREVEELWAAHDDSADFLQGNAVDEVAGEIVGDGEKLAAGHRLLQYEILGPIGEGGMGEVYLAHDTRLARQVAIKVLPAASAEGAEPNARLLREARSAAKLDHPNICTIHEIAESDGRGFIVMQYVEGEDLSHKIRARSLNRDESMAIAVQVAAALAAAHANHIIHRDIKPANIIIGALGQAKVLDFGLAKNISPGRTAPGSTTSPMLSAAGMVMGTVPYMSPEQLKGERLDPRTDIFSFGVMLYEMLVGAQPFQRDSNAETISAILSYDPPTGDLPAELGHIVRKCLEKDPDRRYRDAGELAADMRDLPPLSSVPDTIRSPDGPVQTVSGNNYMWKAAAALIVLILGGIAVRYYFFADRRAADQIVEAPRISSLAVLPFENTDAETEYLSDGITESLINSLSNLPNLRVTSRATAFGFKGKNETTEQIGKDLNVRAVLTGKFTQAGDVVTIQAELVDLTTNSQLWGDRFNVRMTELLQVQEQIARQITDKLQLKLDNQQKQQIAKHYTDNADAYREYLKGRYYSLQYSPEGHKKALEHLNAAIEIDPTYALAYAGIADAYTTASDSLLAPREALNKAKVAAQKAIDLDDKLAEAWAAHGHARLHEWDRAAIDDLNRAIELEPNSLTSQLWLGEYYMIWDLNRSIDVLKKAADLDPLSPIPPAFLSFDYYMLRQPQTALEYGKRAKDLNPYFYTENAYLARYYAVSGDFKAAFDALGQIPAEATDAQALSSKGFVYAMQGKRTEAEKVITEMQKMSAAQYVSPFEFAFVYNSLGDRDKTFLYLEKAFADRSETVGFIRTLPEFDPIRNDPRYNDMMNRAGL